MKYVKKYYSFQTGTQQAFAKPNMQDSRVYMDVMPHSSVAGEMCSLRRYGNHTKDLKQVSLST